MDPFHVVSWMTDVVDEAAQAGLEEGPGRRETRRARGPEGQGGQGQQVRAAQEPRGPHRGPGRVARGWPGEDKPLYRAYLLKERLRDVFKAGSGAEARLRLESWLASACRTRIDEVRSSPEGAAPQGRHRQGRGARHLNARVEAINNKIKLTVRMAYGFRNFDNLVALVMLRCSNLPIALPGR